DGESYLRLEKPEAVAGAELIVLARLDRPDDKLPALLFLADLLRELGAARIGLVAPYLPYMRQDCRFQPGEAVTSRTFARWVSEHFDWLVTVDPHLHRYRSLDEIYTLTAEVLASAPCLADWIAANIKNPLLIGPDAESEQWVRAVAAIHDLPWRVLAKTRYGDREVEIRLPELDGLEHHCPVLLDDIASSGATLAEAATGLQRAGLPAPVCVTVHGLLSDGARKTMAAAGIGRLVCTDSVAVPEAEISLVPLLAEAIEQKLERT
ncbi:MAG: ribose-phosphate diphosphokinase, partial [Wenzhouxiangellaceae bacterium]